MSDQPLALTHYLRAVFTAYWPSGAPSTEVFFLRGYSSLSELTVIANLEASVEAAMVAHDGSQPSQVIFIGVTGVLLTADDVALAGWKVLR